MRDLIDRQAAIDAILRRLDALKGLSFGTSTFRDGIADGYARIMSDLKAVPSAQPEFVKDINVPDNDTISRQAEIERIHRIFSDLSLTCAYDMPRFSCNHGKDYKVIPTKYHKGYQKALEDAEKRIMDALKDGEQDG